MNKSSLSGYNYPYLFKMLMKKFNENNNKPVILRLGDEEHIFVGLLYYHNGYQLEVFDPGGVYYESTRIISFLKKQLTPYKVNVYLAMKIDIQEITKDNLCQTWMYYYLKERLIDNKSAQQIYFEIQKHLLDGTMEIRLLEFLSYLFKKDYQLSYFRTLYQQLVNRFNTK